MQIGRPVFLFGSAIRNLLISRPRPAFRDLDVVVGGVSNAELAAFFGTRVARPTRFGGLHLEVRGVPLDVWPISETWAFRHLGMLNGNFADLPRTTFLDIEAITAELTTTRGRARDIHSKGFFHSLLSKCIDINLEDNPFPDLCVVRSLITAVRLRFSIGRRLAKFVLYHVGRIPLEELTKTARHHYAHYLWQESDLHSWIKAIKEQFRVSSLRPIDLSMLRPRQLQFWEKAETLGVNPSNRPCSPPADHPGHTQRL
jgi:hypothetical protein